MDLSDLFDGYCVLYFRFPDGSEIQCISTLREDILNSYGVKDVDGLIDLGFKKIIPIDLMDYLVDIKQGYEKTLSKLDEFLEGGVKVWWKNA